MRRLIVVCEGHAERVFVDRLLSPSLKAAGFTEVSGVLIGEGVRPQGGGGVAWDAVRFDVNAALAQDPQAIVTTFIDLYGTIAGFPEKTFKDDKHRFEEFMREEIPEPRFVPYIQRYEFEALLFADHRAAGRALAGNNDSRRINLQNAFAQTLDTFGGTPEEIHDDARTCPSGRIRELVPSFEEQKMRRAVNFCSHASLSAIRRACPGFDAWMVHLEALAKVS